MAARVRMCARQNQTGSDPHVHLREVGEQTRHHFYVQLGNESKFDSFSAEKDNNLYYSCSDQDWIYSS